MTPRQGHQIKLTIRDGTPGMAVPCAMHGPWVDPAPDGSRHFQRVVDMPAQWFYGRGSDIVGPVSGSELSDLAATGKILPSDTVWRDGHESGVQAASVKNLFMDPIQREPNGSATMPPDAAEQAAIDALLAPAAIEAPPPAETAPSPAPEQRATAPPRSARATAGRGTIIVGQDGKTVKFRMKCTTCGKEDSSWKSVAIPRGTVRSSFFCPKCRKRQDVEIHGIH